MSGNMNRVRMSALVGTVAVLFGLAGCVPFQSGAVPFIGVRSVDGVLTFKDCSPIYANEIKIRQGPEGGAPKDREWIWIAANPDGNSTLVSSVTYGVAPEGMDASVGPIPISTKSVIQYSVVKTEGSTVVNARHATFDLNQLSSEAWLMASGDLVAEPCS